MVNIYTLHVEHTNVYNNETKAQGKSRPPPIRVCEMISPYQPEKYTGTPEKSILLLGESGAGKSCLLDAFINYIAEVDFDDDYRFALINKTEEERKIAADQHKSQTLGLTCYRIPHLKGLKINFPLNLIDTPGFCDTRGIQFDNTITDQIETLFSNIIRQIDAVCIVIPLSLKRLQPATKDMFDRILQLFSKEIKDNMFVLITNDDGGQAHCLDTLKFAGVPCAKHFRLSNADLFLKGTEKEDESGRDRWLKRNAAFRELFETIDKILPQSLQSSEEIVKARRRLQEQVTNMMQQVRENIKIISDAKYNKRQLMDNKKAIIENKDYVIPFKVTEKILQFTGKRSLNCMACQTTCQEICKGYVKKFCDVIKHGTCTVCSCNTEPHDFLKYKYVQQTRTVNAPMDQMRRAHDESIGREQVFNQIMDDHIQKLKASFSKLSELLINVDVLIKEINKNAIKEDFPSLHHWIDHLIKGNETDTESIKVLKKIREKTIQGLPLGDNVDEYMKDD